MLRILKDTILCGVPVHAGDTMPCIDIPENDLNIVVGAGYAELFTPEVKTPEESIPDMEIVETDTESSEPATHSKKARKRKK